jgi:hypothetical protein
VIRLALAVALFVLLVPATVEAPVAATRTGTLAVLLLAAGMLARWWWDA